jgi:hypothetical protein
MKYNTKINQKGLDIKVRNINFEKLSWKLCQSAESTMSVKECTLAEQEYRRFLSLKILYPSVSLVPNKLVDKFWHEHILDTKSYHQDCESLFGGYLHHFPYFGIYGEDDAKNLKDSFKATKEIYEKIFGAYPDNLNSSSRCEDHACHVESSCACRVEGTCKDDGLQMVA